MMKRNILISGGTGLVGTELTRQLLDRGDEVAYLSRSAGIKNGVKAYEWDINKRYIDSEALKWADHIIHLAGAGVADKRWTKARKKEILDSRVITSEMLFSALKSLGSQHNIKSFISASAIGIYGFGHDDRLLHEDDPAGDDFLSQVTAAWEKATGPIAGLGIRLAQLRIGIVLSPDGGALQKIAQPVHWGLGAPLGSGKQHMSWIHLRDLCRMFRHALDHDHIQGPYNAVGTLPITNRDFTRQVAKVLKKPCFLPPVPGFLLKLALGEMSTVVLKGSRVSPKKIMEAGFTFEFEELEKALKDLLTDTQH